ncbi:hypothetical protein [Celeribacter sp.]|uniref:hypothetical protein n=1 Tax=Celeribacter sp. TaxID=1890673 RepID=UPI003A8E6777
MKAVLWLVLAPFFLTSLVADAVMPVATADGLTMTLCTGEGVVEITIDPATGQPVEKSDTSSSQRCDWAAAQHVAAFLETSLPRAAEGREIPLEPALAVTTLVAARRTGLPPATGPPSAIRDQNKT